MSAPLFLGIQLIFYFATVFCYSPDFWEHNLKLDPHGRYHLRWTVEGDSITFKVEARAKGYIGFGLSRMGVMAGSDIVTGWITDGHAQFQDRHGLGEFMPIIDEEQNWELLEGYENETHTSLIFTRKLNTCDKLDDIKIDRRTYRLIYAFSEEDPRSPDDLTYHSSFRGSKSVSLIYPKQQSRPSTSGLMHWDTRSSPYTLHSDRRTTYWCTLVKGPELPKKHHIVWIEPLLEPGYESFVHHFVLYQCLGEYEDELDKLLLSGGYDCYSPNVNKTVVSCFNTVADATLGGEESFRLPDNAGIPLLDSSTKYYKFGVHFDNYQLLEGVVLAPGWRLYYTPELRKYDVGHIATGTLPRASVFRPPGQKEYTVVGHLNPRCLDPVMPPEGIKIFAVLLHQHRIGRSIRVRHFRNGIELPNIAENLHYDFHHQGFDFLPEEVLVLKGDQITVECTVDTSSRTEVTFDGITSDDEMCTAAFRYYPKIERHVAFSNPTWSSIHNLTGVLFENGDYESFKNRINNLDWSTINITALEYELKTSPQVTHCATRNNRDHPLSKELIAYPAVFQPLIEDESCPPKAGKKRLHSSEKDHEPLSSNFV